jgi:hypothetical protein
LWEGPIPKLNEAWQEIWCAANCQFATSFIDGLSEDPMDESRGNGDALILRDAYRIQERLNFLQFLRQYPFPKVDHTMRYTPVSRRIMPGAQKNGKNNAVTTETLIKAPAMKSRQRLFCIISPLQLLHFIPKTRLL